MKGPSKETGSVISKIIETPDSRGQTCAGVARMNSKQNQWRRHTTRRPEMTDRNSIASQLKKMKLKKVKKKVLKRGEIRSSRRDKAWVIRGCRV